MTARDLQAEAKRSGSPWTLAKGFDTFCPIRLSYLGCTSSRGNVFLSTALNIFKCSDFVDCGRIPDPHNVELWLNVNGTPRQRCTTADMVYKLPYLIHYIRFFFLPSSCAYSL